MLDARIDKARQVAKFILFLARELIDPVPDKATRQVAKAISTTLLWLFGRAIIIVVVVVVVTGEPCNRHESVVVLRQGRCHPKARRVRQEQGNNNERQAPHNDDETLLQRFLFTPKH